MMNKNLQVMKDLIEAGPSKCYNPKLQPSASDTIISALNKAYKHMKNSLKAGPSKISSTKITAKPKTKNILGSKFLLDPDLISYIDKNVKVTYTELVFMKSEQEHFDNVEFLLNAKAEANDAARYVYNESRLDEYKDIMVGRDIQSIGNLHDFWMEKLKFVKVLKKAINAEIQSESKSPKLTYQELVRRGKLFAPLAKWLDETLKIVYSFYGEKEIDKDKVPRWESNYITWYRKKAASLQEYYIHP